MLSVLDVFRVGIGPSSSHTVGPMRIAKRFADTLHDGGHIPALEHLKVRLQGSLAFTGEGHATPLAVIYGLLGYCPETIDIRGAQGAHDHVCSSKKLPILGLRKIDFDPARDIIFDFETVPELHPNAMELIGFGSGERILIKETYFSTGGGFIATRQQLEAPACNDLINTGMKVAHPFSSARELLEICDEHGSSIAQIVAANEDEFRAREVTNEMLDRVIKVMMGSIDRGLVTQGLLPGSLKVQRRAPSLWNKLAAQPNSNEREQIFDWLNVYAMAVNEENASGGQVVTAPTNGAAGIIPAILRHYCLNDHKDPRPAREFLLTAGGIGLLYKQRASISGAEMGCQGEVGVACSMAAGGLAAVWGATPVQVTSAAEIAMEHNLGLTCDPVAGLVQIPCIERNAIGAVKAANAARLAINRSDLPSVSLDQVIETMRQTGLDMSSKYKETSQGGLAVNVVEC
ncbi:MAG: L-serine ammonia-lyase [Erythrobacter sp.]|uniref:L-serine ammonia-lyase n=1 Tax=Erythrobacter sp. TaxID=1042 RepID=UPI0032632AE8